MKLRRAWPWIGLAVVLVALVFDLLTGVQHTGIDFHTYFAAASIGLQQGWSHIYDQAVVAEGQLDVVPTQWSQPFLSPPTVAWIAAPLTFLPYWTAFGVWAVLSFLVFALALAWSAVSAGVGRWIAVAGALSPWWVLHAVNLGQVVPLVAAGTVVAWRLLRDEKQVAAGIVLSVILLKPNTAILVPLALAFAGRYRALAAWLAAGAALAFVALIVLGPSGLAGYVTELRSPLPSGAEALTLKGALDASGLYAAVLRIAIVGMVLATAFKARKSPALAVPAGIVGSLLISPYLHASDLCLLSAAAFIVWEECAGVVWRTAIATGWVLASPFLFLSGTGPTLNRWPLIEGLLLLAMLAAAWMPLTRAADLRTPAPA